MASTNPEIPPAPSPCPTEPDAYSDWTSFPNAPGRQDFGRLTPLSNSARLAFRRQIARLQNDSTFPCAAKECLYYDVTTPEIANDEDISSSEPELFRLARTAGPLEREDLPSVVGFWRLSMKDPPPRPVGRLLGCGRRGGIGVDFLLGGKEDGLHGYHARLDRNLDTGGVLVISDRHQILVDGVCLKRDPDNRDQPEREYMLAVSHQTVLTLSNLTYLLELYDLPTEETKIQLNDARRRKQGTLVGAPDFYLTPSQSVDTKRWKEYEIHPPFAHGSQGTVSYATNRANGGVCAMKEIRFTANGLLDVQNQIRMLQRYQHVRVPTAYV